MLLKEAATLLFEHLISHEWHGYSQVSRWGDGEGTCDLTIGGKGYKVEQGDRDCSSGIISAFEAVGISCGGSTYTGNMRNCMTSSGNFRWHPMSSGYTAKRGDVYLNEVSHTALCLSDVPDMLGEFAIAETGGVDGAEGDQTGKESHRRPYYNYPWDGILECICMKTDGERVTPEPVPAPVAKRVTRKNVHLYEFNGGQNQQWKPEKDADEFMKLTCRGNGLCLDVDGAGKTNGTNVQLYQSNDTAAQRWKEKLIEKGNEAEGTCCVELYPRHAPDMRLDCAGAGLANKTNVQLYKANHSAAQRWYKRVLADGHVVYINVNSGRVLDGGGVIK